MNRTLSFCGASTQRCSGERGCARPPAPPGCWDTSWLCPAPPVPLQHLRTLLREHRAQAAPRAPGWGELPPLPDAHLIIMLPLRRRRNGRKK